jgi:sec-independent protein translocase protein TatC
VPRRLPTGIRRIAPHEELTVVEHLDELRRRLIISVVALVAAFIVAYVFRDQLLDILTEPLPGDRDTLITLSPTEPLFTVLKVCFGAAVVAALPIWLYQLYAFIIPAVSEQSRRRMLAVVAGVSGLFLAGVAFSYFVVLPVALPFLIDFGTDAGLVVQLRAGEYFGFALSLLLAGGLVFEVPVAMLALARIGVVTAGQFRRGWRVAIVVIAFVAAILPGGDPFSMLLLMIPQILLYQVGIWLAAAFGADPLWTRAAWRTDSDESDAPEPPAA